MKFSKQLFANCTGLTSVLILLLLKFGSCEILGFRIWSDLEIMTDEAQMEPDLDEGNIHRSPRFLRRQDFLRNTEFTVWQIAACGVRTLFRTYRLFCLCRPPISVFFAPAAAYEHARLFSHKISTDSSVRILRNENDENIGHDTSNSARMQIPEMTTGQDKSRRGNGSIMLSPEIALMAYLTLSGLAFLKLSLMSEGTFLHICVRSPFTSPKCD